MKKTNAYQRISKAMVTREREVLAHIRKLNKDGEGYAPIFLRKASWGAISRLCDANKIRWIRDGEKRGYWIIKKGK